MTQRGEELLLELQVALLMRPMWRRHKNALFHNAAERVRRLGGETSLRIIRAVWDGPNRTTACGG